MNSFIGELRLALIERLENNVGKHSECKLSKKLKADIQSAIDVFDETLDVSVDTDNELVFLTLLELHIYSDTIGELYEWLKEVEI